MVSTMISQIIKLSIKVLNLKKLINKIKFKIKLAKQNSCFY